MLFCVFITIKSEIKIYYKKLSTNDQEAVLRFNYRHMFCLRSIPPSIRQPYLLTEYFNFECETFSRRKCFGVQLIISSHSEWRTIDILLQFHISRRCIAHCTFAPPHIHVSRFTHAFSTRNSTKNIEMILSFVCSFEIQFNCKLELMNALLRNNVALIR